MKYGKHAGESADRIIERKNKACEKVNKLFWGYNGTLCHPTTQVQPFVEKVASSEESVYLALSPTSSAPGITSEEATHYSPDRESWRSLPSESQITGSKYALVCDKLQPYSDHIDLSKYSVGIGNSEGIPAPDYIQGQVDKGCLIRHESDDLSEQYKTQKVKIDWVSRLIKPYSVFVK